MLLLTGATGLVGSALLPKLLAREMPVRCLVRDPRRLGAQRVRVQIALGDLADPRSFRNALRGVDTVIHLAASTRDEPRGSIEELAIMATWRMLEAAQRAGVERFVFFSILGASTHSAVRLFRAKAVAERIVSEATVPATIVSPSLIYAPGDRCLRLIERLATLPVFPVPGNGRALCQPIWAEDVADCVIALLNHGYRNSNPNRDANPPPRRIELAGPETLTYGDFVRTVLCASGRERPLALVPTPIAARALRLAERLTSGAAPLTWDEAQLATVDSTSGRGPADAQALGVNPQRLPAVLGLRSRPREITSQLGNTIVCDGR